MQIKAEMDVSRLNRAIHIAEEKAGINVNELTEATGLFFSQSFMKALRKSRRTRQVFTYDAPVNERTSKTRTTHIIATRAHGRFFRRKKRDLRPYKQIEHQGMARSITLSAARDAGLQISARERMGDRAMREAPRYGTGNMRRDDRKPLITFVYQSDDIAGWMGQQAARKAIRMTSRRIIGWAGRIQREIHWGVEGRK